MNINVNTSQNKKLSSNFSVHTFIGTLDLGLLPKVESALHKQNEHFAGSWV